MPAKLLEPATAALAQGSAPAPAAPKPGRSGLRSLPEVRWAAAATALFAAGLAAHFAHAPGVVGWVFFLACYAAGGWEPGLAGLRALRGKTLDVDC